MYVLGIILYFLLARSHSLSYLVRLPQQHCIYSSSCSRHSPRCQCRGYIVTRQMLVGCPRHALRKRVCIISVGGGGALFRRTQLVRVTFDFLEEVGECVSILTSVVYLANHVENNLGHLSPCWEIPNIYDVFVYIRNHTVIF